MTAGNTDFERQKAVWMLSRIKGMGARRILDLIHAESEITRILFPERLSELEQDPKFGTAFCEQIRTMMERSEFERDCDRASQIGARILTLLDPDYPKNLIAVYDPPPVLYVKGSLIPEDEAAVAIVGTRHPSFYGLKVTARLSRELVLSGMTIISGLARGIDAEAHRSALKAEGRTIAVLGCGIDIIYPKENRKLYGEIAEKGVLLSEYPIGQEALPYHFPMRNRIIAGLSKGILVTEASQKSGALITASYGANEGREIYAVPGPVDSITSLGTNELIRNGAKLVSSAWDILEDLAPQLRPMTQKEETVQKCFEGFEEDDDALLKLIGKNPIGLDEIAGSLNLDFTELNARLTRLEMQGVVKRGFGGIYVRN